MHIFCDFDNTLTKTDERVVDILNKRFGMNKTVDDITDWNYKSLHPEITKELIREIYSSEEIFEGLTVFDGALKVLNKFQDITFCSIGDEKNLKMKEKFLHEHIPFSHEFIGVDRYEGTKGCVDMSGGVQIDDCVKQLMATNSKYKILFKDYHDYPWQKIGVNSYIYVTNSWKEIGDVIKFLEKLDGEDIEHFKPWKRKGRTHRKP